MWLFIIFILFVLGIVIGFESGIDFGPIFGIIAIILCIVIAISGINLIDDIKASEKTILSEDVTTTYELVPLDFAAYEKDPELSERNNASQYIHIGDKGVFTFCYKTVQDGVEGFVPGSVYSTNAFFPSGYIGNPKLLEITTVYKYHLSFFQKIWLFGTGLNNEKTVVSYEIYIPENSTFNYEQ